MPTREENQALPVTHTRIPVDEGWSLGPDCTSAHPLGISYQHRIREICREEFVGELLRHHKQLAGQTVQRLG